MGKRGSTYASVGRRVGKSEGNGCLPGLKKKKSLNFDSRVDGKTVRGLQEHLGEREEISISRVVIFPSSLTWDHTYCIHLHSWGMRASAFF